MTPPRYSHVTRKAISSALAVALLLSSTASGSASICDRIAKFILSGDVSQTLGSFDILEGLAKTYPSAVRLNKKSREAPKGLVEVHEPLVGYMYSDFGADYVLSFQSQGTAHCTMYSIFRKSKTGYDLLTGPSTDDSLCYTREFESGTFLGIPALIRHDRSVEFQTTLEFAPFRRGTWEKSCQIVAAFEGELEYLDGYCPDGSCDPRLRDAARELAEAVFGERKPRNEYKGSDQKSLLDVADRSRQLLRSIPTFGKNVGYDDFSNYTTYIVDIDQKPVIAVVGGGEIGWRDFPGYNVGFWTMDGDTLKPLAGFQFEKMRRNIWKVDVDNDAPSIGSER